MWLFDQVDCVLAADLLYLHRGPVAEAEVHSDDDIASRKRLRGLPPTPHTCLRSTRKADWGSGGYEILPLS